MSSISKKIVFLLLSLYTNIVFCITPMPKLNWVESCPFMHNDSYSKSLKELSDLIMIQLKNKIDAETINAKEPLTV